MWTFDSEIIENLAKEDKTRITICEVKRDLGDGVNTVNIPYQGGS